MNRMSENVSFLHSNKKVALTKDISGMQENASFPQANRIRDNKGVL